MLGGGPAHPQDQEADARAAGEPLSPQPPPALPRHGFRPSGAQSNCVTWTPEDSLAQWQHSRVQSTPTEQEGPRTAPRQAHRPVARNELRGASSPSFHRRGQTRSLFTPSQATERQSEDGPSVHTAGRCLGPEQTSHLASQTSLELRDHCPAGQTQRGRRRAVPGGVHQHRTPSPSGAEIHVSSVR